jgi:tetratricopeptide (TPR) repeat protein
LSLVLARGSFPAHGDLHERIDSITKQLAVSPNDTALLARRAALHAQHEEWNEALADCTAAQRLGSRSPAASLIAADALAALGRLDAAESAYRSLTNAASDCLPARTGLARVLSLQRRHADAAQLLDTLLTADADPQAWVDAAGAWDSAGDPERALATLQAGITTLGSLVALETPALDLEVRLGRTDAALARVDRLAADAGRPESWLVRRAEILHAAGRAGSASAAEAARHAIDRLPQRLRHSTTVRSLLERLAKLNPEPA